MIDFADIEPGMLLVIPHPYSDAFVLARAVRKTRRAVFVSYWSARDNNWAEQDSIRYVEKAIVADPGCDCNAVADALLAAFMAMRAAIDAAKKAHNQAVLQIAIGPMWKPPGPSAKDFELARRIISNAKETWAAEQIAKVRSGDVGNG